MQPLQLTSFTLTTSLGAGIAATMQSLRAARSGLTLSDFLDIGLDTYIGRVAGIENSPVRADLSDYDCRNNRLAQIGLEQDGFSEKILAARARYGRERIGVFLGTSTSGILSTELAFRKLDTHTGELPANFNYAGSHSCHSLAEFTQRYFDLAGPAFVISTACSSSAKAFANAARMIEAGFCDAALIGGVDSLCLTTLCGFNSLGLLSAQPCRPFDAERNGISIGEGAGFVLLEKVASRADKNSVLLLGVGESSDAYHMSSPPPDGAGARRAMQAALHSANLNANKIDYINLHGTATKANDSSEDCAVFDLFNASVPCSSTKSATGHLLGATGVCEAIISALCIQENFIPGGLHTSHIDPTLKSRYILQNQEIPIDRVLSNAFGFGGSNCSLVLGRSV